MGGWLTVFLGHDLKHDRPIALKVLHPELAAVLGPERFLREIAHRRPASPILTSYLCTTRVKSEGLLYYINAVCRGESLRERLLREKQLPLEDALTTTREVSGCVELRTQTGNRARISSREQFHRRTTVAAPDWRCPSYRGGQRRAARRPVSQSERRPASPEQAAAGSRHPAASTPALRAPACSPATHHPPPPPAPGRWRSLSRSPRRTRPPSRDRARAAQKRCAGSRPAGRVAAEFVEALSHAAAVPSPAQSVAVLPFLNLSGNPENDYFADGITEDVIAQLSKIRALKVISRTSVMPFKKREQSALEIGTQLGVATLLEGSVRRARDRVRIVAQLIDVATNRHLWAETYDRELIDIFAIQSDVALRIAVALRS